MFNVGGGEFIVIALIALIAIGPEQLPSVMRKAGGMLAQARSMTTGLRNEFMTGLDQADPTNWGGSGSNDDPIVPRGYAENAVASSAGPSTDLDDDHDDADLDDDLDDDDDLVDDDLVDDDLADDDLADDDLADDDLVDGDSDNVQQQVNQDTAANQGTDTQHPDEPSATP